MIKKIIFSFLIVLVIILFLIFIMTTKNDGLNKKQMLEDYEYMWDTLKACYPCWGVISRHGIDIDKVYDINKEHIRDLKTENDFYNLINITISSFMKIGHIDLLDYKAFKYIQYIFKDDSNIKKNEVYYDLFFDPEVENVYEKLRIAKKENNIDLLYFEENISNNIRYFDIVENEVAYIEIKSFREQYIENDILKLQCIYNKIKDYKHVIFDVSHNSGGISEYWQSCIVEPNITDEVLKCSYYVLIQKEELNEKFLSVSGYSFDDLKPVSELPIFENVNRDDFIFAPYFIKSEYMICSNNESKSLNGKIWVIISGDSYSATDDFAHFCKETGFATLMGQSTGGSGFGVAMGFFKLPNSKYIIQYCPSIGLDNDGINNIEFGTEPEYFVNGDTRNVNNINNYLKLIKEFK